MLYCVCTVLIYYARCKCVQCAVDTVFRSLVIFLLHWYSWFSTLQHSTKNYFTSIFNWHHSSLYLPQSFYVYSRSRIYSFCLFSSSCCSSLLIEFFSSITSCCLYSFNFCFFVFYIYTHFPIINKKRRRKKWENCV